MTAYFASALGVIGLAALAACSSKSGASQAACDPCDGGQSGSTPTVLTGHDTNLDGVPYPIPAGGYGHNQRTGLKPGNIMQNFKFLGYPNADKSKGLQTVALADYYDPCGKRLTMLHLTVAGVWCVPCNQETDAIVAAQAQLTSDRVVVIQALADGAAQGVPATPSDLNYWVTKHKVNFTEMLDPGLQNLGGFFNAAAIPWNCDLDPRTMEILDESVGWAGDVTTELSQGLSAAKQKPDYPIAVTCN